MLENKKYKLVIEKNVMHKHCKRHVYFSAFAVVDATIDDFPKNFVVVLPCYGDSKYFAAVFPNINRREFALDLLNDALLEYGADAEIAAEIEKRINWVKEGKKQKRPKLIFN